MMRPALASGEVILPEFLAQYSFPMGTRVSQGETGSGTSDDVG
jgi:hypothetical protein